MSDTLIRERTKDVPIPDFDSPAFVSAPALSDAVVAVVTTAGLQNPGGKSWGIQDGSYRTFDKNDRDIRCEHLSPNFDRSGFNADINVVYPLDRLEEMAVEGIIAGVAPRHVSFMGAQDETMTTIRMDTGPAVAKMLKDDGANVVLLTPV